MVLLYRIFFVLVSGLWVILSLALKKQTLLFSCVWEYLLKLWYSAVVDSYFADVFLIGLSGPINQEEMEGT